MSFVSIDDFNESISCSMSVILISFKQTCHHKWKVSSKLSIFIVSITNLELLATLVSNICIRLLIVSDPDRIDLRVAQIG